MNQVSKDIRQVENVLGDRYHASGKAYAVVISDGDSVSMLFDGDSMEILNRLGDLVAEAVKEWTDSEAILEGFLPRYLGTLAEAVRDRWHQEHDEPDLVLHGTISEEAKEALLQ